MVESFFLANVDRCFKLVTPLDRNSNQTRVEIRIQDEYLTPYSTVTFDDIEVESLVVFETEYCTIWASV